MSFLHLAVVQKQFWSTILVLGLVLVGLLVFGFLSLTTSLYTAAGIGLMVVGIAHLLRTGRPTALMVFAFGVTLWLGDSLLPHLTIGDVLSFAGVQP